MLLFLTTTHFLAAVDSVFGDTTLLMLMLTAIPVNDALLLTTTSDYDGDNASIFSPGNESTCDRSSTPIGSRDRRMPTTYDDDDIDAPTFLHVQQQYTLAQPSRGEMCERSGVKRDATYTSHPDGRGGPGGKMSAWHHTCSTFFPDG